MNKTMMELSIFLDMLEKKFPVNPDTIIDKLDLSPVERADWKAFIAEQKQGAQQAQQAEQQFKMADVQAKQQEQQAKAAENQAKVVESQARIQLEAKKHQDNIALEQQKIMLAGQSKAADIESASEISANTIQQRDIASQRDFTAKVAAMDAAEKKDMLSILTWVAEQSGKQNKDAAEKVGR
jgi:hypothetical protein